MVERRDLLVELGTEEMPPTALRTLMNAFRDGLVQRLQDAELIPEQSLGFATPRRLAALIRGLPVRQPDQTIVRRGPAIQTAYDSTGEPTRAAEGFARSCGVTMEALETQRTEKGEWLVYRGIHAGAQTAELLATVIQETLDALPIPKRMRWGSGHVTFVRPVHWSVVLFGNDVVEMTLLDTPTDRYTRGHRFHAPETLRLAYADEYEHRLETEGCVIADFDRRRQRIHRQAAAKAEEIGGTILADDALLDEVCALVEWPVAMVGGFDERFLNVPAEALISSMQSHQKYFPIVDPSGALMPRFVMTANLESQDPAEVVRGNERVIRPRLADAEFFWNQDRRHPLAARVEQLRGIVFQNRLGSLHDKQLRVAALGRWVAGIFGTDADPAERAAMLAKCDLLTQMVGEFPELQGTMGRYYARHDGEGEAVAAAIEEHYRPRFAGDDTPQTLYGQVLAIADRADTLLGIFAIGQAPTGDKDPFALRRTALGLVRTLIEREHSLSLDALLGRAAEALPDDLDSVGYVEEVRAFCLERLKRYYHEQGIGAEVFDAVNALRIDDPLDFHRRVHACSEFLDLDAAHSLAAANKRVRNILRKVDEPVPDHPDSELFVMSEERILAETLEPLVQEVEALARDGAYRDALQRLATARHAVDAFFDNVLVMAEDAAVRANRLALLKRLSILFGRVADLSRLPTSGQ
ncbi:glycine--tRNA ligase subunit beta [Aquisalimonas sp.]|uniref:glycine--tRNA ligase subunit beta n=1 Tax=Aquisalimonas sp. TaxID=1872621 RepID=UPI0025BC24AA|nr:glycine--tRNA ligase subunit beta [Aquisalimonas sp.]